MFVNNEHFQSSRMFSRKKDVSFVTQLAEHFIFDEKRSSLSHHHLENDKVLLNWPEEMSTLSLK